MYHNISVMALTRVDCKRSIYFNQAQCYHNKSTNHNYRFIFLMFVSIPKHIDHKWQHNMKSVDSTRKKNKKNMVTIKTIYSYLFFMWDTTLTRNSTISHDLASASYTCRNIVVAWYQTQWMVNWTTRFPSASLSFY